MALERQPEHGAATDELEKLTEERDLFEEAAEVLEGVYRSRGLTDRSGDALRKACRLCRDRGRPRSTCGKIWRACSRRTAEIPAAAQRVLQQGLSDDPSDSSLLAEIERLSGMTSNWEGAAAALRDAIEQPPGAGAGHRRLALPEACGLVPR